MNHSTKKALVLGATGFIGGHIALAVLEQGWQVRGFRRDPAATGNLKNAPVEWATGNLDDLDSIRKAMQDIDVVFHAAGYYPTRKEQRPLPTQIEYALEQTNNVLAAARETKIERIIYTSTLTTIGQPLSGDNYLATEKDSYIPGTLPKSAYYEAKYAMEKAILQAADGGTPAIVLNPTAVLGPGDVHLTLGRLLVAVARGWAIAWLPVTINIVDVRDVAQAHIQAAIRGRLGQRYIIGGHNLFLKDAIELVADKAKVPPPRFEIPLWVMDALVWLDDAIPLVNLSGNHLRAIRLWHGYDSSKAQVELALTPRPVEETIRDSLAWFQQHGYLPE